MTAIADTVPQIGHLAAVDLAEGKAADEKANLIELVAQAVLDKLEEEAHVDSFIDNVFTRLDSWHIPASAAPPQRTPVNLRLPNAARRSSSIAVDDYHSPLIYKYDGDEISQITTRLLVSCLKSPLDGGGIYELDFGENYYRKIVNCDGRGIAKCGTGFIVASRDKGVFILNEGLDIIANHQLPGLDLHGTAIGSDGLLYIVETKHNRVGIYRIEPFVRIGEIVISPDREDRNHINDICFYGEHLLLSMFSTENIWRENMKANIFDGAILEYDVIEKAPVRSVLDGLKMPHTVRLINGQIHYCESFLHRVLASGAAIAQYSGYTRGLDSDGRVYFVGQSKVRNRNRKTDLTLSGDGGLHVSLCGEHISRFIPLPTTDVYGVQIVE